MSLWLFSEDGLTLVDVTRPQSMIRAWLHHEGPSPGGHENANVPADCGAGCRWVVGIPVSGVTLASYELAAEEQEYDPASAVYQAREHLRRLAGLLNAPNRRPGEAAADVAERAAGRATICRRCGKDLAVHVADLCPA